MLSGICKRLVFSLFNLAFKIDVMKKIFLCISMLVAMTACNNTEEANTAKVDTLAKNNSTSNNITLPGKMCFQYILQRDTVNMELFIKDSAVYGNLIYNMFEKDNNRGTFKGNMHGEIIKADYTYTSEGTTSVREVIFRLKDNTLTEGYGEMEEINGKFIFKDTSKVKFSQLYNTITCP